MATRYNYDQVVAASGGYGCGGGGGGFDNFAVLGGIAALSAIAIFLANELAEALEAANAGGGGRRKKRGKNTYKGRSELC